MDHLSQYLSKVFFLFTYNFVIIVSFCLHLYFTRSAEMHLPGGGIYNNNIIANCLQCASEKILKIGQ